jgi:hypothetical protein
LLIRQKKKLTARLKKQVFFLTSRTKIPFLKNLSHSF